MKILIVEDELPLLEILSDKFLEANFEVFRAEDGEAGLEEALKNHPDMILLDILLPKMDGLEMLGKLRDDDWGKNAQVILLTNLSDSEKVAEATKLGTYDYLVKSDWKLDDVVKKVNEKLGR
ncbi:response regulator [Patescibacteria group bacterium]|nr:response regulator [Patescibacteria group bacterium]MBU1613281.1 response regulator [Patescibacteria group bacterium]